MELKTKQAEAKQKLNRKINSEMTSVSTDAVMKELLGNEWDSAFLDPNKYRTEKVEMVVDGKKVIIEKKIRGLVKNKLARHNLLFQHGVSQEPEYLAGKGRIVDLDSMPSLCQVEKRLFSEIKKALISGGSKTPMPEIICEGNLYYDIKKCGIGFHGDTERTRVVCLTIANSEKRVALTWGDAGENHTGNQMIGKIQPVGTGYKPADLEILAKSFSEMGCKTELIPLFREGEIPESVEKAAVLIIRGWVKSESKTPLNYPMRWQWFQKSKPVGRPFDILLNDGDVYIMSEKAVGKDWKKSSHFTLRHAAGKKYVSLAKWQKREFERLKWEYSDSCFDTWCALKTKYGEEIGCKKDARKSFNKQVEKFTGKKMKVEAPIAKAFKNKKVKLVVVEEFSPPTSPLDDALLRKKHKNQGT